MKKYDTLCSLALSGLAIIFDHLLPRVTRNQWFLFTGLLTLANCLLLIAPRLFIYKKNLDRDKKFFHTLEEVEKRAIADGRDELATVIHNFLTTLDDSHPRIKGSYADALFSNYNTERLDRIERIYAKRLDRLERVYALSLLATQEINPALSDPLLNFLVYY